SWSCPCDPAPSIQDEAVLAAVFRRRAGWTPWRTVDLVDAAEQDGGRVGRVRESVIRSREVLRRDRARDVGRHDHHQFGLPVDVIAALEQRAENRKVHQGWQSRNLMLRMLLEYARHVDLPIRWHSEWCS